MSAADTVLLQLRAKELCVRNAKSKWSPLGDHGSAPVVVWVTERAAESYFLQVQRAEDDEQAHFSSSVRQCVILLMGRLLFLCMKKLLFGICVVPKLF